MINRTARRFAVAATSAAVAGTALVGATATSANAAEATTTYTCTAPANIFSGDFPVTVNGGLPGEFWAGASVPDALASNLAVSVVAQVPAEVAAVINGFGIKDAKSDDFGFSLGSATVPAPVAGPFETTDGATKWNAAGTVKAFSTPKPGSYDVKLPQAFTITANANGQNVPVPCTLAEGQAAGSLGTIKLNKQTNSAVAAKNVKAKKGKKAAVKVTVTADAGAVTGGKVTVLKGKKKVGSANVKNGKATVKVAKLPVGKNKLTLKYGNNPSVAAATGKVTVTVKK
ncbi:Ig-like domain-containing protein [Nocardioides sp. SOB72]|uniref:Ig-like domain-containing protein n=2 Tax=Nocardioides abyssi TaxID=3058370 RepID=A0ABT8EPB3_9ACTN|nr:Ig-like domain-containing protein [Nocardioides abyssi]